jgi:NAD(P)H-hydrate repair Nnr-like enzyme with NAD(P)H-hydrate dehydratase domain
MKTVLSGMLFIMDRSSPNNTIATYSDRSIPVTRIPLLAAVAGSMVTRTTSGLAFEKYGRSVVTQDMLSEIGKAFTNTFENESSKRHPL